MQNLKDTIVSHYQILLQDKIDVYQDLIASLTEDAQNDAKSSAGDKHETTLSKLHIEQEKIAQKLNEALTQKQVVTKIDLDQQTDRVVLGSLVKTNNLIVLIATALPKITIDNQSFFSISPQSPLGEQLLGQEIGHTFQMNQVHYEILEIL